VGLGLIGKEPMHSQGEIQQHKGLKEFKNFKLKKLAKFWIKLVFKYCTGLNKAIPVFMKSSYLMPGRIELTVF